MGAATTPGEDARPLLHLEDFRSTGLLWLINRAVLHPRGYALAVVYEEGSDAPTGWKMLGDGTEPWHFGDAAVDDAEFAKVEAFLGSMRPAAY